MEDNSTEGKTLQVYCLVKGDVLRQWYSVQLLMLGFLKCTQTFVHVIALKVCMDTMSLRESALKVDHGRKLSLHGGVSQQRVRSDTEPAELNPHSSAPQTKLSPLNP